MRSKAREFVVYEVLPEKDSGTNPFLGATEGNNFVQQDSWIGYQVKVIEKWAYNDCKAELEMRTEMQLELQDVYDKLQAKADKLAEALVKVRKQHYLDDWAKELLNKRIAEYRGENK